MSTSKKDTEFQSITAKQLRLFAARNKRYSSDEFDAEGYWHTSKDSSSSQLDDVYFLVSDLTDINGEPQCAPIKRISTKSKSSESGYWDAEGYHYYDPLKAEKFFNSIEEKKEAYAERNMIIESRDNSIRIQYNKLSARLQELRDEHERLAARLASKRIDSRMLEIEYEIDGNPNSGKKGLLDKLTAIEVTMEQEYGEKASTPNPYAFCTNAELTVALAQANKFCGLDENDSKIRGAEDLKRKRYNQLVGRRETLIQEKESLVEMKKDFGIEVETLNAAANEKRSSGLNAFLGAATLFTVGFALIPIAIYSYYSIKKRNERREEIAASEMKITARTKEIESQLNKINSEIRDITKEIEGQLNKEAISTSKQKSVDKLCQIEADIENKTEEKRKTKVTVEVESKGSLVAEASVNSDSATVLPPPAKQPNGSKGIIGYINKAMGGDSIIPGLDKQNREISDDLVASDFYSVASAKIPGSPRLNRTSKIQVSENIHAIYHHPKANQEVSISPGEEQKSTPSLTRGDTE